MNHTGAAVDRDVGDGRGTVGPMLAVVSGDEAAFSDLTRTLPRDAPSETSLVAALNGDPVVLASGDPTGISACAKIVSRTIHIDVRKDC